MIRPEGLGVGDWGLTLLVRRSSRDSGFGIPERDARARDGAGGTTVPPRPRSRKPPLDTARGGPELVEGPAKRALPERGLSGNHGGLPLHLNLSVVGAAPCGRPAPVLALAARFADFALRQAQGAPSKVEGLRTSLSAWFEGPLRKPSFRRSVSPQRCARTTKDIIPPAPRAGRVWRSECTTTSTRRSHCRRRV